MKNQIGFIPKTWKVQPDYYRNIFDNWNAVFIVDDGTNLGTEYHLQLTGDILGGKKYANTVEVLRQDKDCRRSTSYTQFKSIKKAYAALLPKLITNN